MFSGNRQSQPQSQFFINNNRIASQQSQQQIKPVLGLSGQFVQSNDQQQPPLSTTTAHLLNSGTHQPVQPTSHSHSVQVSGNGSQQYLASNNKVQATGILPNVPSSNSANEPKKSASSSSTLSNPNASSSSFVMNSAGNQMPIMNVQQGRNQPQLSTSSCSFYSERITSSSNLSESSSVAISSSTNGSVFFVLFFSPFCYFFAHFDTFARRASPWVAQPRTTSLLNFSDAPNLAGPLGNGLAVIFEEKVAPVRWRTLCADLNYFIMPFAARKAVALPCACR